MSNNIAQSTKSFHSLLESMKPQIAAALPKHLSADRMLRIALTCYRTTPALAECEPMSVIGAIVQCAQLGLEPGLMGQAYLIPFSKSYKDNNGQWQKKKECQFMPGYRGLVSLARRSGDVTSINAEIVYENDEFELTLGVDPRIVHKPNLVGERGQIKLVYAIAKLKDGGYHFDWMTIGAVEAIRARNDAKNNKNSKYEKRETPWDTDYEEMVKKTMIRRITKMLPMSIELAQAVAVVDAVDQGKHATIDGDFVNVIDSHAQPEQAEEKLPPYDSAAFVKNLPGWEKLIASGKKTAADLISTLETKNSLSVDQQQMIKDIKQEQQA